jgi:hypothetical protein
MLSRRVLLTALSGALAGVAGCTARTEGPGTTTDATAPPPSTSTVTDGSSGQSSATPSPPADESTSGAGVDVSDVVVRKAVRYESAMGSGGVLAGEGEQYVVASVRSPDGGELDPSGFAFVADGETWSPGLPETRGAVNVADAGREGSPLGRGRLVPGAPPVLAFVVPSPLTAAEPRIRFDGQRTETWSLPAEARERLARPAARFGLDSLSVPASVSQGEPLSVSVTVTNVSETSGRFLAALYWPTDAIADDDESHVLERVVGAGETATLSTDIDTEYTTYEPKTVTLELRGHVGADREVQVADVTTPS